MEPLSRNFHIARPRCVRAPAAGGARGVGGFSLVEAIVSAGIVGIMLVASLNLLGSAARTRAGDNDRRTAIFLAHELLSEVQQQNYKDPSLTALLFGPELGENARTDFDDVDDYNKYTEKPPKDHSGAPMGGMSGFKRSVRVGWVQPSNLGPSNTDTGLVMIEVTVVDARGVSTSAYSLRGERATAADPPPASSTWVQWTSVELEVGGATPRRVNTAVNPVARPPTP